MNSALGSARQKFPRIEANRAHRTVPRCFAVIHLQPLWPCGAAATFQLGMDVARSPRECGLRPTVLVRDSRLGASICF